MLWRSEAEMGAGRPKSRKEEPKEKSRPGGRMRVLFVGSPGFCLVYAHVCFLSFFSLKKCLGLRSTVSPFLKGKTRDFRAKWGKTDLAGTFLEACWMVTGVTGVPGFWQTAILCGTSLVLRKTERLWKESKGGRTWTRTDCSQILVACSAVLYNLIIFRYRSR